MGFQADCRLAHIHGMDSHSQKPSHSLIWPNINCYWNTGCLSKDNPDRFLLVNYHGCNPGYYRWLAHWWVLRIQHANKMTKIYIFDKRYRQAAVHNKVGNDGLCDGMLTEMIGVVNSNLFGDEGWQTALATACNRGSQLGFNFTVLGIPDTNKTK